MLDLITRADVLPIIVMYGFVLLLAPFIGIAMYWAFDGDRMNDENLAASTQAAPESAAIERPASLEPIVG